MTADSVPTPPAGHRERLVATISAVIDWQRDQAHEAQDIHRDKRASERSYRAFSALKQLRNFVLRSLPADDPLLRNTFRYCTPQDDRYQICSEAWEVLSSFCVRKGTTGQNNGKPTEAQMRNVLNRAEGREQEARALQRAEGEWTVEQAGRAS